MTTTTNGHRPHLTTVTLTEGNRQVSSGEQVSAPPPSQNRENPPPSTPDAATHRDIRWWGRLSDYFTPPSLLTDPAPPITELADYAHRGAWTSQYGLMRTAGIWWHRLVSLPATVRYRFKEWIVQRPGRWFTAAVLVKAAAHTPWGAWLVDNVIYPAYRFAGWVFL